MIGVTALAGEEWLRDTGDGVMELLGAMLLIVELSIGELSALKEDGMVS